MKQQGASGDSLRCRDNPSRVDFVGCAFAGSQRQIQSYVNEWLELLNNAVAECLSLNRQGMDVNWVSPVRSGRFAEYRDGDFLRRLGLAHLALALRKFWPRGGPCWDAPARFRVNGSDGYLLIEAKSHPPEIDGKGSCAAGPSLTLIGIGDQAGTGTLRK
jgi:hypothetical protein